MAEEGKVKGFFKNIGKKLDSVQLESELKSEFKKANKSYGVFKGATTFGCVSYGFSAEDHMAEGYIVAYTQDNITNEFLLEDDADHKVYYIESIEDAKVTIHHEDLDYERDAKKITVGSEAVKVEVIKVGDSFYQKKN